MSLGTRSARDGFSWERPRDASTRSTLPRIRPQRFLEGFARSLHDLQVYRALFRRYEDLAKPVPLMLFSEIYRVQSMAPLPLRLKQNLLETPQDSPSSGNDEGI